MDEAKRLVKNTGIIAVGGMATKLVQFFLLPLYTSVLSTAEYGTVDYINTIAVFLVPVVSLLMDEALFRYLIDCRGDGERTRVITCACAAMLLGCVGFSLLALIVWAIFKPGNLVWVVALVMAQALIQMTSAILRGSGDTVSYSVMNFVSSVATIGLNLLLIAVLRLGVIGMITASIVAQGGTAIIFLIRKQVWNYLDFSQFNKPCAVSMIRYSIPLIPNKVSWTIMNMVDRLIIMNVLGAGPAGIYAISYKFPDVMDTVYGFFYQSWKESSARALNSEEDESVFYNAVYQILRRFMTALVLVMTALMPIVYGALIDVDYREGLLYVPILLLATYYSNISGFYGGIFTAHRVTGIMGTTTLVSALLCLVLCVVLIPSIGLWGASISTLASLFMVNEYRRIRVRQYASLDNNPRGRLLALVALVVVFGLYYAYCFTGVPICLLFCISAAFAYAIPSNWDVIKRLLQLFKSVFEDRG